MHRLATTPGGWTPDQEGVIFVEQTPAPIALLTAADTDIQTLAQAVSTLPPDFPAIRVASLLNLQQNLAIDTYADTVLAKAQVIILRLLGGRAYWAYGLEVVQTLVQQTGACLIVLPGDDRPDADLAALSTLPLATVHQFWRYWVEGGVENLHNSLLFLAQTALQYPCQPTLPKAVPSVGLAQDILKHLPTSERPSQGKVGLLFYRSHYLAGNTQAIVALCQALSDRGLEPVPLFVSSLRDADVQAEVWQQLQPKDQPPVSLILNTTSFAIGSGSEELTHTSLWHRLNVPVLQVILSGGTIEQWQTQTRGLSPRDIAMNVALPEVDGRIITRAVSFKTVETRHAALETDVVRYEPVLDRIAFVADLATNWVQLHQTPVGDRRVAIVLANYPTRDGRLANGVGLDTPASCVEILKAMQQAGYYIPSLPETGDALIQRLTSTVTNDPEARGMRPVNQSLPLANYQHYLDSLAPEVQQALSDRWGNHFPTAPLPISGIQLGHVFVGIQPARGYDRDPSLNYHAPDLEPTHEYLAFYAWLRDSFGAQAIVHVGKHGNLEWLPGKGIALSQACFPEVALGALPHLYPFIVNDPGEGSQAKRRSQAVIVDHLTPPMTRAELHGRLQDLEALSDEYYNAQSLDPARLPLIQERITQLIQQEHLAWDLHLAQSAKSPDFEAWLLNLDGYLCELKEAQIRDGLHIFGQCPVGNQLRDLIVAIARHPTPNRLGLTRALAADFHLDWDPLTTDMGQPWSPPGVFQASRFRDCRTVGAAIAQLETHAASLIEHLLLTGAPPTAIGSNTAIELTWIQTTLLPALYSTSQELTNLLRGLNGGYVPPGTSGAPTRGRPEVLPTGRNFYSVDIRSLPTETAWAVGRLAAEAVVERYTQDHGEYPKTLGLSIWGTSTMRTGGDDLAEALALLGVQPVWDGVSRRVVDFEILPLTVLGRPRVDVTLRISGFFRDAFANLIDLFDRAVVAVADLDEPATMNPVSARVRQEIQAWEAAGLSLEQAEQRSRCRIFGSKPGAYGAGLQGLIDSQAWTTDADLAHAYLNWSSYAYTSQKQGFSAPEAFEQRLREMQIVLQNQDNREHDLLDSDDYYQFQGGLTTAVRTLSGQQPRTYFGDHSCPENPKVRSLQAEVARVYRARVTNPKWIAGVMRHGYKGAFEMAATVDYLFAYDATAHCVEDFMYQGVAAAYLLNPTVQEFTQSKNPWALRDMAERLLEANQRGLWRDANPTLLEQLRTIALQAESVIEAGLFLEETPASLSTDD